jgi:hypothetical protein
VSELAWVLLLDTAGWEQLFCWLPVPPASLLCKLCHKDVSKACSALLLSGKQMVTGLT